MNSEYDKKESGIKSISHTAELCDCGRLYKDRRDEHGNIMCSACYTELSVEQLKELWSHPLPRGVLDVFKK